MKKEELFVLGKRPITPETAKALGEAFNTSAQYWINLESIYQILPANSIRWMEFYLNNEKERSKEDNIGIGCTKNKQGDQNGGEIRYAGRLTREEEKNIILYMIQQNKQGD